MSRLRHSLGDASIRASALLGSWVRVPSLLAEADAVELLKASLRETRAKNGDQGPHTATQKTAVTAPHPVKVKREPLSDDEDRVTTSHASSSKEKAVARTASSVPKARPATKLAASSTAASGSSTANASLPPPLIRRKSSKGKVAAAPPSIPTRRADTKGKRATRVPVVQDHEILEISSVESEDE